MADTHLDKRTVEARSQGEIARLEARCEAGIAGVATRVKLARLRSGLSQLRMSLKMKSLGFSWTQKRVWQVEQGISKLHVDELDAVASLLECCPVWLMYGE